MFNNQRYITRGVLSEITAGLQLFMWQQIRSMPEPKDYLQVFTLSEANGLQKVVHTQEVPGYKRQYLLKTGEPVLGKVFVIDDKTHSTMLLSSEY